MNIAEEHFKKLSQSETFRKAYIEESIKFDLEMKLSLLKDDINNNKSNTTVLKKIKSIENFIKNDFHLSFS
jgi:hypothetical protein